MKASKYLEKKLQEIIFSNIKNFFRNLIKEQVGAVKLSIESDLSKWIDDYIEWHKKQSRVEFINKGIRVGDVVSENLKEKFIQENVSLINETYSSVRGKNFYEKVKEKISSGEFKSQDDLIDSLMTDFDIPKSRAEFWATDQTLKLHSDITKQKIKDGGYSHIVWVCVRDERVRASHLERHGKLYPIDNDILPGREYRCRCTMKPANDEDIAKGGMDEEDVKRDKNSIVRSMYKNNSFVKDDFTNGSVADIEQPNGVERLGSQLITGRSSKSIIDKATGNSLRKNISLYQSVGATLSLKLLQKDDEIITNDIIGLDYAETKDDFTIQYLIPKGNIDAIFLPDKAYLLNGLFKVGPSTKKGVTLTFGGNLSKKISKFNSRGIQINGFFKKIIDKEARKTVKLRY